MHDLVVKSRVHPKYKTKYHVGNWPDYDRALAQRGDLTLWPTPDAIAEWETAGVGKRGGQLHYSDIAIETALTLRLLFHQLSSAAPPGPQSERGLAAAVYAEAEEADGAGADPQGDLSALSVPAGQGGHPAD